MLMGAVVSIANEGRIIWAAQGDRGRVGSLARSGTFRN